MIVSDEEYDALREELNAKQKRRNAIIYEIEELQDTLAEIVNTRRNLPTAPGMYWHPDENWPAYLNEDGHWSDGWGNEFESDSDLEHVKRVGFTDD